MAFARQAFAFIFIFVHIIFAPSFAEKTRSAFSSAVKARSENSPATAAGPAVNKKEGSPPSSAPGPTGTKNEELPLSPANSPAGAEDEGFPLKYDEAEVVVKMVTTNMADIETKITEFRASLKKRHENPERYENPEIPTSGIKECFPECDKLMVAAIDDIKNTLDSMKSQNFVKASSDISEVLRNVATCEDCFAEMIGGDAQTKVLLAYVENSGGEAINTLQSYRPPRLK